MTDTITLPMIDASSEMWGLWLDHPNRLAGELFPESLLNHDYRFPPSTANIAAFSIYHDLEQLTFSDAIVPAWLEIDQFEDWLAARAIKCVIRSLDAMERRHG